MALIATLTLNPALDVATETEQVRPTDKLRCSAPRTDPGGGGVNVARVVTRLGGEAVAVFPAGGPTGAMLTELLEREGVSAAAIPIAGQTRQSFVVDESSSGLQYRFVLPGPELSPDEQARCLDRLFQGLRKPAYVVVSGSAPPGVGPEFWSRLGQRCAQSHARLVLDTSGAALTAANGMGAYLLKPNLRELEGLAGRAIEKDADAAAAARTLIARGMAEVIVVSLGERGALLVTADEEEAFPPVPVSPRSAVGAGDSMVAGLTYGLASGFSLHEAVRLGVAAGAAAVLTPGSDLAHREDIERLYGRVLGDSDDRDRQGHAPRQVGARD